MPSEALIFASGRATSGHEPIGIFLDSPLFARAVRRRGGARPSPCPAVGPPTRADIARVEAYMNGLHTLKSRFLQVAPDGSTAGGVAWVDRPGRMRFQYDPPSPLLLVAGHGLFFFP